MALPVQQTAGAGNVATSGTTVVPALPVGWAAGDLVIVSAAYNSASNLSISAGWTQLIAPINNANLSVGEWYRIMVGGDTAPTVTSSASGASTNGIYARCYRWTGVDTTTPVEAITSSAPGASTTPNTHGISTLGSDRQVVCIYEIDDDTAWTTAPPPALWSLVPGGEYSTATGGDIRMGNVTRDFASAASPTSTVFGTLSGSEVYHRTTFAIIGASGGGTPHEVEINDSVTMSDGIASFIFDRFITVNDSVTMSDNLTPDHVTGGGTPHTRDIDDSVTMSDAFRFDRAIVIADTLAVADNLASLRAYFRTFDDSVTMADARTFAIGKALADTLSLADSMRFDRGMTIAETVALVDALSFQRELLLADPLPLSDELTPLEGEGGTAWERNLDDSVSVSDAMSFARGITLSDNVSLTDLLRFDRLLVLTETVAVADVLSMARGITLADSVSVADELTTASTYNIFLTDELDLSDNLTLASQINVELDDALLIRDAILRYKNDILITDDVVAVVRRGTIVIGRF
jgi:hypothetical protein